MPRNRAAKFCAARSMATREGWQSALEQYFQVRRYTFDARLQSTRDFSELDFNGRASALGNALKTAVGNWRGQPVAGVVLFTDGNATDIGADLPPLDGGPPIYPVVLGKEGNLADVSLKKVAVSQTAFEDAPVTIQAGVSANGFSGQEIVARLTEVATGQDQRREPIQPDAAGLQISNANELRCPVDPARGGGHGFSFSDRAGWRGPAFL